LRSVIITNSSAFGGDIGAAIARSNAATTGPNLSVSLLILYKGPGEELAGRVFSTGSRNEIASRFLLDGRVVRLSLVVRAMHLIAARLVRRIPLCAVLIAIYLAAATSFSTSTLVMCSPTSARSSTSLSPSEH
jgi:hypothetical protein